jgi:flagellar protein FliS
MNAYLNNHYEGMTPEELIHMLYKGALKHIRLAKEGVLENNPKKRGEHLSKVIAIISELNSSINTEIKDESVEFLQGLYAGMLAELPKTSINNDPKALDLTRSYIEKLNEIWETQVLPGTGENVSPAKPKALPPNSGYNTGNDILPKSFFV